MDRPHPGAGVGIFDGILEMARHRAEIALLPWSPPKRQDGGPLGVGADVVQLDDGHQGAAQASSMARSWTAMDIAALLRGSV